MVGTVPGVPGPISGCGTFTGIGMLPGAWDGGAVGVPAGTGPGMAGGRPAGAGIPDAGVGAGATLPAGVGVGRMGVGIPCANAGPAVSTSPVTQERKIAWRFIRR